MPVSPGDNRTARTNMTKAQLIEELEGMELALIEFISERPPCFPHENGGHDSENSQSDDSPHNHAAPLEQQPDLISYYDVRGKRLYVNGAFCRFIGKTREALLAKPVGSLISDESTGSILAAALHLRPDNPDTEHEYEMVRHDGERRWILWRDHGLFDAQGNIDSVQAVGRDITARKHMELELLSELGLAKNADQAKTDFLAGMSHELRTPLNAIIGFAGAMMSELFGPMPNGKYEEYVHDIYRSGNHLLALINDILDISAIEADKLALNEERLDIDDIIDVVVRLILPRAEAGKIKLVRRKTEPLPSLFADERRIKQILINLLGNAVKFTREGGTVSVEGCAATDGSLSLSVTDNGIGMSPDVIALVMEPFGRADDEHVREAEGTGLGLPLTAGLVRLHGGELEIDSEPKMGTTVTVVFPPERVLKLKP